MYLRTSPYRRWFTRCSESQNTIGVICWATTPQFSCTSCVIRCSYLISTPSPITSITVVHTYKAPLQRCHWLAYYKRLGGSFEIFLQTHHFTYLFFSFSFFSFGFLLIGNPIIKACLYSPRCAHVSIDKIANIIQSLTTLFSCEGT